MGKKARAMKTPPKGHGSSQEEEESTQDTANQSGDVSYISPEGDDDSELEESFAALADALRSRGVRFSESDDTLDHSSDEWTTLSPSGSELGDMLPAPTLSLLDDASHNEVPEMEELPDGHEELAPSNMECGDSSSNDVPSQKSLCPKQQTCHHAQFKAKTETSPTTSDKDSSPEDKTVKRRSVKRKLIRSASGKSTPSKKPRSRTEGESGTTESAARKLPSDTSSSKESSTEMQTDEHSDKVSKNPPTLNVLDNPPSGEVALPTNAACCVSGVVPPAASPVKIPSADSLDKRALLEKIEDYLSHRNSRKRRLLKKIKRRKYTQRKRKYLYKKTFRRECRRQVTSSKLRKRNKICSGVSPESASGSDSSGWRALAEALKYRDDAFNPKSPSTSDDSSSEQPSSEHPSSEHPSDQDESPPSDSYGEGNCLEEPFFDNILM